MRIHFNLKKALAIVEAVETEMSRYGLHVHGLSGDELKQITTHALQAGKDITASVKDLALEAKTAAGAPEVK